VPRDSESAGRRSKGVPLAPEMYSAARMMSEEITANAREDAEVHEALCHCPECGAERFTEFRERQ
jgi:hypothetical protein